MEWVPEIGEHVFVADRVKQSDNGAESCANKFAIVHGTHSDYKTPYVVLSILNARNQAEEECWAVYIRDLDPIVMTNKVALRFLKN
jgi:hypothetical protein